MAFYSTNFGALADNAALPTPQWVEQTAGTNLRITSGAATPAALTTFTMASYAYTMETVNHWVRAIMGPVGASEVLMLFVRSGSGEQIQSYTQNGSTQWAINKKIAAFGTQAGTTALAATPGALALAANDVIDLIANGDRYTLLKNGAPQVDFPDPGNAGYGFADLAHRQVGFGYYTGVVGNGVKYFAASDLPRKGINQAVQRAALF